MTALAAPRIPTLVFCVGSALATKFAPTRVISNTVPAAAVGRLPGVRPVKVAPGSITVILIVTTIDEEVPELIVTVPVRTLPGEAALNSDGLKVKLIVVPKL